jgi:hypothetical protein
MLFLASPADKYFRWFPQQFEVECFGGIGCPLLRRTDKSPRLACAFHPKLKEVLHGDFADCSALGETLSGQYAAVFCLGTYTGAVSDAELRTITVDYRIEFARVLRSSSPDAAFSFLSGNGADPTGRSRHATRERPRRHYLRRGFRVFTSSDPRTSIPWSRGRNPISATACCARCIRCFECFSPTG